MKRRDSLWMSAAFFRGKQLPEYSEYVLGEVTPVNDPADFKEEFEELAGGTG